MPAPIEVIADPSKPTIESRDIHVKTMRPGFDETWDRFADLLTAVR